MRFAPKPENDFAHYIRTYYDECRSRFDKIQAIAGKWMFRDLIPGMSDFDTRFLCADDMTAEGWCRMSMAVGEAHLSLCRRSPAWVRNLEHLPGVNLTWAELMGERSYYPEYRQWSFYHSENPRRLTLALQRLADRPWDDKDEYFHLRKFCLYYGRYNRTIDPAINMGSHANKYPLHSRLMHYFSPPVQSAMSILERRPFVGKFEAFEAAAERFPEFGCWETVWEILHANYETPKWYEEPYRTQLEDDLEEALKRLAHALRQAITLVPEEAGVDIPAWKAALARVPVDPALVIFDNAKFSRLMKGRLHFYAHAPAYFDTRWLIRNELNRIGTNFFVAPFRAYWRLVSGESVNDPAEILGSLEGHPLTAGEVAATREFHRLTARKWDEGTETEAALAIAAVFDGFYQALAKIAEAVQKEAAPVQE
jgi:hypothetical protein